MKLLEWIIKMAKKLLNLDTTTGAKSWEDGKSLPSGTANQTLRHNGTDWESTSILETKGSGIAINGTYSGTGAVQAKNTSTGSLAMCYEAQLFTNNGHLFYGYAPNVLCTINAQGKIKTTSLSGTGTALLEALPDGTIQRSATVPTKTKIITRVLTSASSIHSFNNTDLGITGDLTTKIISFELLRRINGNDYFSLGELVQTEKTLTSSAVTFATGEIPSGDTIRLAITYTE